MFSLVAAALLAGCIDPPKQAQQPPYGIDTTPYGGYQRGYGTVVKSSTTLAPISGGTLAVTRDGAAAIAADPDRDSVFVVDLATSKLAATLAVPPGSQPGRIVEDGSGRVHVVLRAAGAVASIDLSHGLASASIVQTRAVCEEPRGLAWHAGTSELLVACVGGELVRMPAAGGGPSGVTLLGTDLRDVVVAGAKGGPFSVYVTRFRTAEVLRLGNDYNASSHVALPDFSNEFVRKGANFSPMVAWRAVALPDGSGVAVIHERGQTTLVGPTVTPAYYTNDPESAPIVHTALSLVTDNGALGVAPVITGSVLPVDVAISSDGQQVAIANAGNVAPRVSYSPGIINLGLIEATVWSKDPRIPPSYNYGRETAQQIVAVAFAPSGALLSLSREPAALNVQSATVASNTTTIALSDQSRLDTGHLIFHSSTGDGRDIACASCHAEGGDDAHVWNFAEGIRRTPPLRGGIANRAPYHWGGEEHDMRALCDDVLTVRMAGPQLTDEELGALGAWVETVPQLPRKPASDGNAVARGKSIYDQKACASCHDTPMPTLADVGTGSTYKAPPLAGLVWRTPLLHTGCAATVADRFGPCGGGSAHGGTTTLSPSQVSDLTAYLESL
jgi:mono/diheme cytochrome c family protein/DNA-binding beta-propeller fold protein YncE